MSFCLVGRSESPNMSEGSDSTNYLTTVSVERYNNRPSSSSIHRSSTIDGANPHQRMTRYTPLPGQDEFNRNHLTNSLSKSIDTQVNYRTPKMKRSVEWDEENLQQNEGKQTIFYFSNENESKEKGEKEDIDPFESSYSCRRAFEIRHSSI